MKENKIFSKINELQKKCDAITSVMQNLIHEIQKNASMAGGTLTALQLHVGETEWEKIIEDLKDKEKRLLTEKDVEKGMEKRS